jgi:hypothetical protein
MNLPGVDTYVCDASASARGSQICPLPDGRRKSPIGTKRRFAAVRMFGRYRSNSRHCACAHRAAISSARCCAGIA